MAKPGESTQVNVAKLRELLVKHAVSDDLRVFCFDLGVNYDEVVSASDKLQIAVVNTIQHFEKRGRLSELIQRSQHDFPHAAWPEIFMHQVQISASESAPLTERAPITVTSALRSSPRMPGPLRVFLSYAPGDKLAAHKLYFTLKNTGVQPWLDEEDLLPGQKRRVEIPKAIQASDMILACLSKKSEKAGGYIQREIEFALDIADKQPSDTVFIIPVLLEKCEIPERLREYQWVNYSDVNGYERLVSSLKTCAVSVGATQIRPLARCKTCHGTGQVRKIQQSILGSSERVIICPTCRGAGRVSVE